MLRRCSPGALRGRHDREPRGILIPLLVLAGTILFAAGSAAQQTDATLAPVTPLDGSLHRVTVHGTSLEGNLAGDSPDRQVTVYLPPSYSTAPQRRYPVVYLLHGFTDSDLLWMGWQQHFVNVPAAFERAFAANTVREMILVMPDAFTAFSGSFYGSSVNTGDWERYVAEELVAYVDGHYRTLADRASRALAGHSMGGYGTIRIGMERPDVFSTIYAMSPCCMAPNLNPGGQNAARLEQIGSVEEVMASDFGTRAVFASAAAWSANPNRPPLYLDLPTENGDVRPDVIARWVANAPLATVHQHIPELRSLRAIALDSGAQDRGIAAATREMSNTLTAYGIEHFVEIYDPGDHTNRIGERVETVVLPFLSRNLEFGP